MAVRASLINPNIDYGNPTDVRMNNGNTGIARPPIIRINDEDAPIRVVQPPKQTYPQTCPEGKEYRGKNALGKPICVSTVKYRNKDKQAAYEETKAQAEKLMDEAKDKIEDIASQPNLLKKYWWVLAAAGILIILND